MDYEQALSEIKRIDEKKFQEDSVNLRDILSSYEDVTRQRFPESYLDNIEGLETCLDKYIEPSLYGDLMEDLEASESPEELAEKINERKEEYSRQVEGIIVSAEEDDQVLFDLGEGPYFSMELLETSHIDKVDISADEYVKERIKDPIEFFFQISEGFKEKENLNLTPKNLNK